MCCVLGSSAIVRALRSVSSTCHESLRVAYISQIHGHCATIGARARERGQTGKDRGPADRSRVAEGQNQGVIVIGASGPAFRRPNSVERDGDVEGSHARVRLTGGDTGWTEGADRGVKSGREGLLIVGQTPRVIVGPRDHGIGIGRLGHAAEVVILEVGEIHRVIPAHLVHPVPAVVVEELRHCFRINCILHICTD